jgi:hypothetical protein
VRFGCQPVVVLLLAYLLLNFGAIGGMESFPLLLTRNGTSGLGLAPFELGQVMLPITLSPPLTLTPNPNPNHGR